MIDVGSIFVQGLLVGSFYALLAVGLTLVYAIAGIENLAHGSYVMIGAYASFLLVDQLGLPTPVGLVGAVFAGVIAAVLTWKGLVKRVLDNPVQVFMVTLVLALVLQEAFIVLFGAEPNLSTPLIAGTLTILGVTVTQSLVLAAVISVLCLGMLGAVMQRTYIGRSVVAVAQNPKAAQIAGIDIDRIYLLVWILSGAFAGFVGVFYGYYTTVEPHMWVFPLIYSFSIVIVGGLGSLKGSVAAAYIISFVEIATIEIDPGYKGIPALLLLVVIMLVRPKGLFGREELG